MDRLEEIKETVEITGEFKTYEKAEIFNSDFEWMVNEIERLRTVEQAYQALLSATAGQQK